MRLAVLDTDVVISAGIRPDCAPAKLMMEWMLDGRVQVVTSPWIVAEYRTVARRKKFAAYGFPPVWLEFLIAESLHLPDPPRWAGELPDEKDAPFLALAAQTGAWLITGNLKHFPTRVRGGVVVISPAEYLSRLES